MRGTQGHFATCSETHVDTIALRHQISVLGLLVLGEWCNEIFSRVKILVRNSRAQTAIFHSDSCRSCLMLLRRVVVTPGSDAWANVPPDKKHI